MSQRSRSAICDCTRSRSAVICCQEPGSDVTSSTLSDFTPAHCNLSAASHLHYWPRATPTSDGRAESAGRESSAVGSGSDSGGRERAGCQHNNNNCARKSESNQQRVTCLVGRWPALHCAVASLPSRLVPCCCTAKKAPLDGEALPPMEAQCGSELPSLRPYPKII